LGIEAAMLWRDSWPDEGSSIVPSFFQRGASELFRALGSHVAEPAYPKVLAHRDGFPHAQPFACDVKPQLIIMDMVVAYFARIEYVFDENSGVKGIARSAAMAHFAKDYDLSWQ
jgi:hypothetical protein